MFIKCRIDVALFTLKNAINTLGNTDALPYRAFVQRTRSRTPPQRKRKRQQLPLSARRTAVEKAHRRTAEVDWIDLRRGI